MTEAKVNPAHENDWRWCPLRGYMVTESVCYKYKRPSCGELKETKKGFPCSLADKKAWRVPRVRHVKPRVRYVKRATGRPS